MNPQGHLEGRPLLGQWRGGGAFSKEKGYKIFLVTTSAVTLEPKVRLSGGD